MASIANCTGIPNARTATASAVSRPPNAAFHAETRPEARSPSSTATGRLASRVEIGQEPHGS